MLYSGGGGGGTGVLSMLDGLTQVLMMIRKA